jgi:hypothetical protein
MAKKPVTFDFYSLDYDDYKRLNKQLEKDKSSLLGKWYKYKYQNVRLESWEYKEQDNIYIGYCSKLNTKELPLKGSLTDRDLTELGLADHEGTASVTAFALIPGYKTLILQRNANGVKAGSFLYLLGIITGINDLELSIMIDSDALRRLNKMKKFTTFKYKIANPTDASNYAEKSVKEAATLANHYQSRTVAVELSMGQFAGEGTMAFQKIIESVRNLLKLKSSNDQLVQSIYIKGKETDDDTLEPLELIQRKLTQEEKMELKHRFIPPEDLMQAVYKVYNDKRKEISAYKSL